MHDLVGRVVFYTANGNWDTGKITAFRHDPVEELPCMVEWDSITNLGLIHTWHNLRELTLKES